MFLCELKTENEFKVFWKNSVVDFIPFYRKSNIMDPANWGQGYDRDIANFVLYWST